MKLSSVQAFVLVAEQGSIRAAARQLGMSQPALSKSLRVLEEELAAPLLTRSALGVVPTAYGKAFLLRARLIVSELRKSAEDVAQLRGELEGKLTISVSPASTSRLAPVAISSFRSECPNVDLHILEGVFPYVGELIRNGQVDVAIGPLLIEPPKSGFAVERLLDIDMVVAARRGHPLAGAKSLAELESADWLHLGVGDLPNLLVVRTFRTHQLPPPRLKVECRSLTTSIMLLQSSDLLCLLPRPIVEDSMMHDSLAIIAVREPIARNTLGLIRRSDTPLTRVGQIFATHVRRTAAYLSNHL
jgi:LysR family transcriptional regulator, regulator of abg operon